MGILLLLVIISQTDGEEGEERQLIDLQLALPQVKTVPISLWALAYNFGSINSATATASKWPRMSNMASELNSATSVT